MLPLIYQNAYINTFKHTDMIIKMFLRLDYSTITDIFRGYLKECKSVSDLSKFLYTLSLAHTPHYFIPLMI